jgi:hypothetical protein
MRQQHGVALLVGLGAERWWAATGSAAGAPVADLDGSARRHHSRSVALVLEEV